MKLVEHIEHGELIQGRTPRGVRGLKRFDIPVSQRRPQVAPREGCVD